MSSMTKAMLALAFSMGAGLSRRSIDEAQRSGLGQGRHMGEKGRSPKPSEVERIERGSPNYDRRQRRKVKRKSNKRKRGY